MQYPSYANNPRTSLCNARGEFPAGVHGPSEPASAVVNGEVVDLGDRLVSHYQTTIGNTTGKRVQYVMVPVSESAFRCLQLAPMLARKLAEAFSPYSGNVMSHIAASKGESNWLLSRDTCAIRGHRDFLEQALREGSRRCGSVARATEAILRDYYNGEPERNVDRIERVWSPKLDHVFVRVFFHDGTCVVHDQWINPEAFLAEDGRFSTADDLCVETTWRPGESVPQRWEDLLGQGKAAGEIQIHEFPPQVQQLIHAGEFASDLMGYARRTVRNGWPLHRTESDCLLTPEQAAQRGLLPDEKIAYQHKDTRDCYLNDAVTTFSLARSPADPSFPALHLQQARWEIDVEAAFDRRDLAALQTLLKQCDTREWVRERHGNLCLRAMSLALNMPIDAQNKALIDVLFEHAIDAATATQMQLMLRKRAIEGALRNRDADALEAWLSPESVAATGDHGSRWLMVACQALNTHGVKSLLKAGAQFHAPHGLENGLSLAIEAGGTDMVKLLIKRGASALRPNGLGVIPWYLALLLLQDQTATGVDQERRQAVAGVVYDHAIAEALALRPVDRALLEGLRGSIGDGALRNKLTLAIWRSDLEQACSSGNVNEISLLLASDFVKADRAMRKKAGIAASALLCRVVESAPVDPAVVDALLAGGVEINRRTKGGKTPLLVACKAADVVTARRLLDAGAKIDALRWKGYSALDHACWAGSQELVRLLIDRGAPTDVADAMGEWPVDVVRRRMYDFSLDESIRARWSGVLDVLEQAAG